ncbi:hypothetical protein [Quadrisphaera sp. KR29]|uniref:hypothetical protein n=1 Tax=Quadrisphaera sp. KR29 TaxID=3461391 RepID=UPI0040447B63
MGDGSNIPGSPYSMQYGVRVLKVSPNKGSLLLDPTPSNDPWAYDLDQIVKPGTTWSALGGGVQVRTSTTASTASTGQMQVLISVAPTGASHWASSSGAVTTTTTLSAPSSAPVGSSLTLSGTVSAATGSTAPTGMVNLAVGFASATASLTAGSGTSSTFSATFTAPSAGTHSASATYVGTVDYAGSNAGSPITTTPVVVPKAVTTTTLDVLPALVAGQPASITGTVTASGTMPTGSVTVSLGSSKAAANLSNGRFTVSLTPPAAGAVTVQAAYGGSTALATSNTSASATVMSPSYGTTTTVMAPASTTVGTKITVTGRVTAVSGTPKGRVTVTAGSATASADLKSGSYSVALTPIAAGAMTMTATFAPSAAPHTASSAQTSMTVAPRQVKTVTTVTTPKFVSGTASTVTGRVSAAVRGTVHIQLGSVTVTAPVSSTGSYSAQLTPGGVGPQPLTVSYSGADAGAAVYLTSAVSKNVSVTASTRTTIQPLPAVSAAKTLLTVEGSVTSDAGLVSGTVTLTSGGTTARAAVSEGRYQGSIKLDRSGVVTVRVAFLPADGFTGSAATATTTATTALTSGR